VPCLCTRVGSDISACPKCGTDLKALERGDMDKRSDSKNTLGNSAASYLRRLGLEVNSKTEMAKSLDISSEMKVTASKRRFLGPGNASSNASPQKGSSSYPRYVTPDFKPFDPLELARETEEIVCRGRSRKYTNFYSTKVYGGIATGYACGCCLRCVFCWVDWSRDFPESNGRFYSPEEVFSTLGETARKFKVKKLRVSGAEPTLGREHLLGLLELVEASEFDVFILETNGILFGSDKGYVEKISKFKKPHVRVSLKAGTPEAFTRKTGAKAESFELPFKAIRNLLDYGASFHVAAMSLDPRIMKADERRSLVERIAEIDPRLLTSLEEEVIDPYKATLARLRYAGIELEWPLRRVYAPIRSIQRGSQRTQSAF
jgi:uncharacterized Fe-S cluster-containing radical SAM superfamily protein